MGEAGDYGGAKYDSDFSMFLEELKKVNRFHSDSFKIGIGGVALNLA
jgi:hypothetical protein